MPGTSPRHSAVPPAGPPATAGASPAHPSSPLLRPTASTVRVGIGVALLAVTAVLAATVYAAHGPLSVDHSTWSFLLGHRSGVTTAVAEFVSTVLSPVGTVVLAALAAALLWRRDHRIDRGASLLATVVGAAAVTEVLKILVHRTRPPMAWQLEAHEAAGSFPSGHTTGAAALAFGLAVLVIPRVAAAARAALVLVALSVASAAALSRLYLGMHWLTDVVAAMLIGLAAALIVPTLVAAVLPRLPWLPRGAGD